MSDNAPALHHYPARLAVRVPAGVPEALAVAARANLTSPSEYLRRAVLQALKADGVRLDVDGRVTTGPT